MLSAEYERAMDAAHACGEAVGKHIDELTGAVADLSLTIDRRAPRRLERLATAMLECMAVRLPLPLPSEPPEQWWDNWKHLSKVAWLMARVAELQAELAQIKARRPRATPSLPTQTFVR